MKILAVDTSGKSLSLALCEDDRLIAELTLQQGYNHSVTQMPMLEQLLAACELTVRDIDLFVSTIGPGSFTGIRIGVSSVKAMAYAAERPAVGVCSLETLVYEYRGIEGALVCPAVDARRGRVFGGLWRIVGGRAEAVIAAGNRVAAELAAEIFELADAGSSGDEAAANFTKGTDVYFAGDGQDIVIKELSRLRESGGRLVASAGSGRCISTYAAAQLGLEAYLDGAVSLPQALMPEYLSPSQAERMRDQGK